MLNTKQKLSSVGLFVVSLTLIMLFAWISAARIDIKSPAQFNPWVTGPWFKVSLWQSIAIASMFSMLFVLLAKYTNQRIGWCGMLTVSLFFLAVQAHKALPSTQLKSIIGEYQVDAIKIQRFESVDMKHHGTFLEGKLAGNQSVFERIKAQYPSANIERLEPKQPTPFLNSPYFSVSHPSQVLRAPQRVIVFNEVSGCIYFEYKLY